ncbi:IS3 family transposase [Bacillus sp. S/N-304-OC-R1]|nr:IS3 family transposase [Bacillus sp. S/N-304-OC-R1]MBY0122911.1 IS3 family transposase [Bacillus sp. S/N-304-OC-R1]
MSQIRFKVKHIAIHAIDEYIHFHTHERYQKRLNGLSPMEYRAKAA